MPSDEGLLERIRECLGERDDVQEKKMFGGVAFMVAGHMCCGPIESDLMVRVGPDAYDAALAQPGVQTLERFTKRAMRGLIIVEADVITEDDALQSWVEQGLAFVTALPPK